MNNRFVFMLSLLMVVGIQAMDEKTQLAVGQQVVANFLNWDVYGHPFNIHDDLAGKNLVLIFFPTINWRGANTLAMNLRKNVDKFKAHNIEVVWVSPAYTHKNLREFAQKYKLPFIMVADECAKNLAREFDTESWLFNYCKNCTVLVDKDMKIVRILKSSEVEKDRFTELVLNSFGFNK
jgi:peroxiredoxin